MSPIKHEVSSSLRIQKARTALVLDYPFFGSLLFFELRERAPTAAIGRSTPGDLSDSVKLGHSVQRTELSFDDCPGQWHIAECCAILLT